MWSSHCRFQLVVEGASSGIYIARQAGLRAESHRGERREGLRVVWYGRTSIFEMHVEDGSAFPGRDGTNFQQYISIACMHLKLGRIQIILNVSAHDGTHSNLMLSNASCIAFSCCCRPDLPPFSGDASLLTEQVSNILTRMSKATVEIVGWLSVKEIYEIMSTMANHRRRSQYFISFDTKLIYITSRNRHCLREGHLSWFADKQRTTMCLTAQITT